MHPKLWRSSPYSNFNKWLRERELQTCQASIGQHCIDPYYVQMSYLLNPHHFVIRDILWEAHHFLILSEFFSSFIFISIKLIARCIVTRFVRRIFFTNIIIIFFFSFYSSNTSWCSCFSHSSQFICSCNWICISVKCWGWRIVRLMIFV